METFDEGVSRYTYILLTLSGIEKTVLPKGY